MQKTVPWRLITRLQACFPPALPAAMVTLAGPEQNMNADVCV